MSDKKTIDMPSPQMIDPIADDFWSAANLGRYDGAQDYKDLNVGLSDLIKAVGAGALDLVGGIGEAAHQASEFGKKNADGNSGLSYADQASARMANRLSPVFDAVSDLGGKAKKNSTDLVDSMGDDAKEALRRSIVTENDKGKLALGDGAGDIDVWAMKLANGVSSVIPVIMAGGISGVAARQSIGRAVTDSMLRRGASQWAAEAVADKVVKSISSGSAGATAMAGSVGSAGLNAKESINAMTFDDLKDSKLFKEAFLRIDGDEKYQNLSSLDKLSIARDEIANLASVATMRDAKTWGAAAGSLLGDASLLKVLAGKRVVPGTAKWLVGEGAGEGVEEGAQQYVVNNSVSEVSGIKSTPWRGVVASAIESGLTGSDAGSQPQEQSSETKIMPTSIATTNTNGPSLKNAVVIARSSAGTLSDAYKAMVGDMDPHRVSAGTLSDAYKAMVNR